MNNIYHSTTTMTDGEAKSILSQNRKAVEGCGGDMWVSLGYSLVPAVLVLTLPLEKAPSDVVPGVDWIAFEGGSIE